jgi:hypothetical protein
VRYILLEVDDEAGSFTGSTWREASEGAQAATGSTWYGFPARIIRIEDTPEGACEDIVE